MSKFFKSKKAQAKMVETPSPRSIADITAEYNQTALLAGSVQYQIKVYESQLNDLNQKLLALNNEGALRQKVDAETAKAAALATHATETNKTNEVTTNV